MKRYRYSDPSTKVLVYKASELHLGQTVSFQYKATTVDALAPSLFIKSPVHVSYSSLPPSVVSRGGRKYKDDSEEVRTRYSGCCEDSDKMERRCISGNYNELGGVGALLNGDGTYVNKVRRLLIVISTPLP